MPVIHSLCRVQVTLCASFLHNPLQFLRLQHKEYVILFLPVSFMLWVVYLMSACHSVYNIGSYCHNLQMNLSCLSYSWCLQLQYLLPQLIDELLGLCQFEGTCSVSIPCSISNMASMVSNIYLLIWLRSLLPLH